MRKYIFEKIRHQPGSLILLIGLAILVLAQTGCSLSGETSSPTVPEELTINQVISSATVQPTCTQVVASTPINAGNQISIISPSNTLSPTPIATPHPDYFSIAYPLSKDEYIIPLTVRHVTEQRATLFFELSNPSTGRLIFSSADPEKPQQGEIIFSDHETRHMITLEDLSPGIHYQAFVLLGDNEPEFKEPAYIGKAWGKIEFHTASDRRPLRIGILGDASFGDDSTEHLIILMASQNLDFVINTGDVVYETDSTDLVDSYLRKYFGPFSRLLHQMPIYTVMGNHDYDMAVEWQGAPFYDHTFPAFPDPAFSYPQSRRGNQYYAFAYQDVQFLMLDSQVLFGEEGRADQEAWMNERLSDPRFSITIPVFHVAPYSSSVVHPDDGLPVRYSWLPIFEAGNVLLVFSGHFHDYERLYVNGITYIVTGGGSSTLYALGNPLPESQIYARRTHFVLMEIYTDHIQLKAISMEGDTFDQMAIHLK